MFNRRSLRSASFLALFALVWGIVFPTLANAGVGNTNSVWAEICTANGVKKIQQSVVASDGLEQAHAANTAGHQYTAEHCALCCLGGSLPGVATDPLQGAVQLQARVLPLPVSQVSLPQQIILLTAAPRAPPVSALI